MSVSVMLLSVLFILTSCASPQWTDRNGPFQHREMGRQQEPFGMRH